MKKLLLLFLAPILLSACGDSNDNESANPVAGTWSHVFRADRKDYHEERLTFSTDGNILLISVIKTSNSSLKSRDTINSYSRYRIDTKMKTVHILDNYDSSYTHSVIGKHNPEEPGFYNYEILPNDTLRFYFTSIALVDYERKYVRKK